MTKVKANGKRKKVVALNETKNETTRAGIPKQLYRPLFTYMGISNVTQLFSSHTKKSTIPYS